MPISEDELDHHHHHHRNVVDFPYVQPHPGMSKAELRKSNKPIMEKRRRARINQSLNELKSLILDAMKKDPSRHSKLEKADILEMTVKHLQTVQRQQMSTAVAADPSVLQKFQTGFSECATEVSRYIGKLDGVERGVKQRLLAHLSGCVSGLNQIAPLASSALAGGNHPVQDDVNNNLNRVQLGRLLLPQGSAFRAVSPPAPPPISPTGSSSSSSSSAYSEHGPEPSAPEVTSTTPSVPEEPPSQPLHRPLTVVPPPLDYSLKRSSSCLDQDDDRPEGRLLLMKCPRLSSAFTLVASGSAPAPSTSAHSPRTPPPPPSEPTTTSSDVWRPW